MSFLGKKYLLLLDMNGTVCYRSEFPVDGVREDLYIRHKYYYKRHGVDDFVRRLSSSGRFEIAVYSSMMSHNLEAGVNAILHRERHSLVAMLDRTMNKPDSFGENEWDTVRDMKKVWKRLPAHGPKTTILLDNEARKFRDEPRNGVVVPEFGPTEARRVCVKERKADTLASLLQYLLNMAADDPDDVRDYMEENPPALATRGRPAAVATAVRLLVAPPAAAPTVAAQAAAATAATGEKKESKAESTAADALGELLTSLTIERKEEGGAGSMHAAGGGVATTTTTEAASSSPAAAEAAPPPPAKETPEPSETVLSSGSAAAEAAAEGAAAPPATGAAPSNKEQQRLAEEAVPRGTSLHLLCVKDGDFIVRNAQHGVTVRGPASSGIRIDAKMDFHRLVEEAVSIGGVRLKVAVEKPDGTRLFEFVAE